METEKLQVSAKTLAERAILDKMVAGKPKRNSMTEHAGLPVKGYQPQSEEKVQAVNHNKELEETLLRVCDGMKSIAVIDQRWLAIARTHFEEGFMAMNRSIFKPGRVRLRSDGADNASEVPTHSEDFGQTHRDAAPRTMENMPTAEAKPPKATRDDIVA